MYRGKPLLKATFCRYGALFFKKAPGVLIAFGEAFRQLNVTFKCDFKAPLIPGFWEGFSKVTQSLLSAFRAPFKARLYAPSPVI